MNTWVLLALLSPALLTIVNFIDKYVVESKVKDYQGIPIFSGVIAFAFATVTWCLTGFHLLPFRDGILILTTGFLTIIGYYFYFHALVKNTTSYIITLLQMTPVFTLLLSVLFLQDVLTLQQFFGFLLVLSSVIAFSLKKEKEKFRLTDAFWFICLADVLFAIANILIKFAFNTNSFAHIFIYESWGLALGGLSLFVFVSSARKAFLETINSVGKSVLGILTVNEVIFISSKVTNFLAISLGPVAMVSVLSGTQVFFGILYGWLLMFLAPKIYNEDITKEGLVKKIVFTTLLFIGIWLIS